MFSLQNCSAALLVVALGKVIGAGRNCVAILPLTFDEGTEEGRDSGRRTPMIADAMRDAGFEVLEAGHAEEALAHLKSRPATIHLLFTDNHMPGQMTGHALACYVAAVWPHIALLVTSGQPPDEQLPSGCIFLRKPYETDHAVAHARKLTGD